MIVNKIKRCFMFVLAATLITGGCGRAQVDEPQAEGPFAEAQESPDIPESREPEAAQGVFEKMVIKGSYLDLALRGVYDMVSHYWNAETGEIQKTWNGYPKGWDDPDIIDPRGTVWPRSMFLMPTLVVAELAGDEALFEISKREWNNIRGLFSMEELTRALPIINTSVDDCGWNALLYLYIYRAFNDEVALQMAMALMEDVFDRWYDDEWGGPSIWYRDRRDFKSLYQVGVLLACFELSEITGDESWRMLAKLCYDTLEEILLRDDDIYFCDYNEDGAIGRERPNDIREGGSVTFLAGNMAMGVLHAKLYRLTGDDMYLERALRTARGIRGVLSVEGGVYLNERDAWATGTFAPQWAKEVLTLPGITQDDITILYNTAASIAAKARTEDGFYGGSWSGPADGPGSQWWVVGSKPQQIMTSGNTVLVLAGAAMLEHIEAGVQALEAAGMTREELRGYADQAYNDLIKNFWLNHRRRIAPTDHGYIISDSTAQGNMRWERAQMVFAMHSYYMATGDEDVLQKLRDELDSIHMLYAGYENELDTAFNSRNIATDDAGWHIMEFLIYYNLFGDEWCLERAINLTESSYRLGLDDVFGGGMWYLINEMKSVYAASIIMSALELYEITGDEKMYNDTLDAYLWIESHLRRDDGLYFVDYNQGGPVGRERPDDIREAGSVTFIGGNMGMAVINARLYRSTGEDMFLQRALSTVDGILAKQYTNGILLSDRDAWTNASFVKEFVSEVLTLPGVNPEFEKAIYRTAKNIATIGRTEEGFYGASWHFPPYDAYNRWHSNGPTRPEQIMTSATSANMVISAYLYHAVYAGLNENGNN